VNFPYRLGEAPQNSIILISVCLTTKFYLRKVFRSFYRSQISNRTTMLNSTSTPLLILQLSFLLEDLKSSWRKTRL